jgi:lysophospholipase L1-like esterase
MNMKKLFIAIIAVLASVSAFSAEPQKPIQSGLPVHAWQGRKVAFIGDSITDPNVNPQYRHYWAFLQDWLGITPYVYAVSGREWNDVIRQGRQLKDEHGDDVDAILIFMGTNDYNHGIPLGSWYTESLERVEAAVGEPKTLKDRMQRHLVMTDSTFKGRINMAMAYLKKAFPTKQIVLLTPIHRAGFYAGDTNWQPTEDYENLCGEYLDAYIQAVQEAAQVWAVPVIDLAALSGLYPMEDAQAIYFNDAENDRLHPSELGYKRIALTLYYQLQSLPCSFD